MEDTSIEHPGELLKSYINLMPISKIEAANIIGIYPQNLSEIFSGKRNISTATAIKLEKLVPNVTALEWLTYQAQYDISVAKK